MVSRARDPRTQIVERGYDTIARTYADWSAAIEDDPRFELANDLVGRLAAGARVLDLGCGAGVPTTAFLAERFHVTGVDISTEQLRRARENVPNVDLIHADIVELDLSAATFDAVTAFYSLTHLPRERLETMFRRIATWLVPGGLFLASLGADGGDDWTGEWLGTKMFFSSFDADTNRRLLMDLGFELDRDEVITMREPEGPVAFLWVLARKV